MKNQNGFAIKTAPIMEGRHKTKGCFIMLKDAVKVVVQIAVGVAVGTMANDFAKKHVGEPLAKFMDSLAEKREAQK